MVSIWGVHCRLLSCQDFFEEKGFNKFKGTKFSQTFLGTFWQLWKENTFGDTKSHLFSTSTLPLHIIFLLLPKFKCTLIGRGEVPWLSCFLLLIDKMITDYMGRTRVGFFFCWKATSGSSHCNRFFKEKFLQVQGSHEVMQDPVGFCITSWLPWAQEGLHSFSVNRMVAVMSNVYVKELVTRWVCSSVASLCSLLHSSLHSFSSGAWL